ncbi:MAG: cation-transporting P-type ATPase [Zoogloeaceae bacterium]|jgi:magnesium-transporting ATPase (P-type)|nr:cation-transporting P-type ATPase [Zoogloeaceae bacterium]
MSDQRVPPAPAWHNLPAEDAAARLEADCQRGLSQAEAEQRLLRHGPNRLPPPPRPSAWLRFLRQFHNVLIYIMLIAAAMTALLAHWIDTAVLLAAVLVNACIGFIQEGKAEAALDAIRNMLSLRANVIRDGERGEIAADDLVPGDIVVLASGDKAPADLRLVAAKGLLINEALLTGESEAVEKSPLPVAADAPLGDRRCMLYSGTLVAAGQATGIVVATGAGTELGRIGTLLQHVQETATPLLRQIAGFSRWLALAIVLMAIATFVVGVLWRGHAAEDMFMIVVALVASAIPEGLPAIMTIALALGVRRMAARHAIIRHLPAVETLGAVTIICSDKTGTLTRNEMTAQRVITANAVFEVSGAGYAPQGALRADGVEVSAQANTKAQPDLAEAMRAAALCNDASLRQHGEEWQIEGDPTEGALVVLAVKAGIDPPALRAALPRVDTLPFESERRLMATLHHEKDNGILYVKGAPERILEMCATQGSKGSEGSADVRALDADYWRRAATDCAARGLRLLALAARRVDSAKREVDLADLEDGFTLLALVGIADPPREEAISAVAACADAGIRVKMITGDHAETARAIGAQMGIGRDRPALTGAEIELLDDAQLRRVVPDIDVFARASPEHKLRLVEALQAAGHIVAMTGDGVNDAPALKRADIGVAMGLKGTEAAKEAADMVLADDNFATIANAVREGRGIYDNIRKFVLFMLPTNGGEGLIVIATILFELVLPLTPVQVLWINMATSATLGLALAFERPERGIMRRRPRNPRASLLSWFFVWRVVMVSILMMAGTLGLFLWELGRGTDLATARTMAVSAVVAAEMFYLINSRHLFRPALTREGLFGNRQVLIALAVCAVLQLAFVYAAPLQAVFGSAPLSPAECLKAGLAGLLVFVVAELEKAAIRRFSKNMHQLADGA